MIDISDVEIVIEECFNQTTEASRSKYDTQKADQTAALFLTAQIKLSMLIENFEMNAKNAKNEISRIEAEKYFEYKENNQDKKITENMLISAIAKDPAVVAAKLECSKIEATLKKYNYLLNTLKDGHVFFRNIGKNKSWQE